MIKTPKLYKTISIILFALSLVPCCLYAICSATAYESDVQYFARDCSLYSVFVAVTSSIVVVALLLALLSKPSAVCNTLSSVSLVTRIASVLCAVSICVYQVFDVLAVLDSDGIYSAMSVSISSTNRLFSDKNHTVRTLSTLFAIVAVVYFIRLAIKAKHDGVDSILHMGFVVYLILRVLAAYFSTATPINGPFVCVFLLGWEAYTLYALTDIRFSIGKPMARAFVSLAPIAFMLLTSHGLGTIVAICAGKMQASYSIAMAILEILVSIIIVSNYISFLKTTDTTKVLPGVDLDGPGRLEDE